MTIWKGSTPEKLRETGWKVPMKEIWSPASVGLLSCRPVRFELVISKVLYGLQVWEYHGSIWWSYLFCSTVKTPYPSCTHTHVSHVICASNSCFHPSVTGVVFTPIWSFPNGSAAGQGKLKLQHLNDLLQGTKTVKNSPFEHFDGLS